MMTAMPETTPKPAWRGWVVKGVLLVVGLAAAYLIFTELIPQFGNFEQGLQAALAIPTPWLIAIVVASILAIAVYPLTAPAAIPGLPYKAAFVDRQAGFLISTGIPWGGGAIAVGTQYAILARYGVSQKRAAAAVAADAVWTYLMTFGAPAIGLLALFLVERRTVDESYELLALGAAIVFGVSVLVIALVLRSEVSARRVGGLAQSVVRFAFRVIKKAPPDVAGSVVGFHDTASEMVATRWKQLTLTNAAAQVTPFLVIVFALIGMGAFGAELSVLEAFVAFSVALLVASVPIAPGGLGTVDAALIGLLVYFGASPAEATAVDLIWRAFNYFPQMFVGFVAFLIFAWDRRRDRRRTGSGPHVAATAEPDPL